MATHPDIPFSHHLVYGKLKDFITGEELIDTDDERIRQQISTFMVEQKGYSKSELIPRLTIETIFHRAVTSTIDLTVQIDGCQFMIIRYAAGSLVSRERSAVAAARILNGKYQIPLVVVTNGRDAELIDSATGNIRANGLLSIPDRIQAKERITTLFFPDCPQDQALEREMRILNAFDVERCCL